ncbi:type I-E CRISPR-associated endoribonuclease Cas2e [Amycolatopsis jiangsuensis]|uniref:CRISPR-associated protein Cas2 n=1 Tax=Amycolatopsis jiangsuensis TaxID=1181879 RepID=A0A840IN49_9PSEU|nr:type I-E CRISPR-associated endoribonuclease Cas2e [Amycolatopsis jiangsuensis]MBB4682622.1 CRISPR-associated protein Cas2 [Amycolatopsis jiangsuensis]
MTVIILTAVPPGLRGHLTRWLLEISPGVYVGFVSTRVRELIWDRITEYLADGRALMVHATQGEQRLDFQVHGHDWTPVDYDGITLMRRQTVPTYVPGKTRSRANPAPAQEPAEGATTRDETVWKRRNARRKFRKKE